MTAILRATAGPSTGSEFWISEEVFRVGGDAASDWRLQELEPHALTVQFRQGRYAVINRGSVPLEIDGIEVPPGRSAAWAVDGELHIGPTTLWLWSDGDPTPSARPHFLEEVEDEEEVQPGEAATAPAPRRSLVGLTLALGASLAFVWATSRSPEASGDSSIDQQFEAMVLRIQDTISADDPLMGSLRPTLQEARVSEIRQQSATALSRYRAARDLLLARQLPETGYLTEVEHKTAAFVESRILAIEKR